MEMHPSDPDTIISASAHNFRIGAFSWRIVAAITVISTGTVAYSNISDSPDSITYCNGIARITETDAPTRLPDAADLTASMPFPSLSSLWPGSRERTSSASGAPTKTEGTKSVNEWTTAADTTAEDISRGMSSAATVPDTASVMMGIPTAIRIANVFTCIPGMRPEAVPMAAPMMLA